MVLVALLVAAGAIVGGILTAAGLWFLASIVASLGAAYLLWHRRNSMLPARPAASSSVSAASDGGAGTGVARPVWVVDGAPQYHRDGCQLLGADAEVVALTQALEDGFVACGACAPATR